MRGTAAGLQESKRASKPNAEKPLLVLHSNIFFSLDFWRLWEIASVWELCDQETIFKGNIKFL